MRGIYRKGTPDAKEKMTSARARAPADVIFRLDISPIRALQESFFTFYDCPFLELFQVHEPFVPAARDFCFFTADNDFDVPGPGQGYFQLHRDRNQILPLHILHAETG